MAVGKQHHHTVDTNAQARCWRQAVFQRGHVVFIEEHGFVVTRRFRINLILEALRLIFCIVQLAKAVADFAATDEEFKAVSDLRVLVVTTRQRRNFCRVFGDEGRLNQVRFRHFFEDLGHDTAQNPSSSQP